MEITDSDKQKVALIIAYTQVGSLVHLLKEIKKDALVGYISNTPIEHRESFGYRMMIHALDFYNNIQEENSNDNEELTPNDQ